MRKELARKQQLDEQTLCIARDVKALRERNKQQKEQLDAAWAQQSSLLASRHTYEGLAARLELAATLQVTND